VVAGALVSGVATGAAAGEGAGVAAGAAIAFVGGGLFGVPATCAKAGPAERATAKISDESGRREIIEESVG
jgi:hypothetical protein